VALHVLQYQSPDELARAGPGPVRDDHVPVPAVSAMLSDRGVPYDPGPVR